MKGKINENMKRKIKMKVDKYFTTYFYFYQENVLYVMLYVS